MQLMGDLDLLAIDWGATPWNGSLDDEGVAYAIEGPEATGILTVQVWAGDPPHRTIVYLSMRYPRVEEVLDAWYACSGDRPVTPWTVSMSRWAGDLLALDVPVWLADDDITVLEPTIDAGFAWLADRVENAGDSGDMIATLRLDPHRSWQSEAVALLLAGKPSEATALVWSMVARAEAGTAKRHASRVREFAAWFMTVGPGSSS